MMIQSKTNNHLSLIIWLGVLYICRDSSTVIESSLQINLFMQNKANFRKVKLNVNSVLTRDYERLDTWWSGKTKPIKANQSQLKPIKANKMPKQTQLVLRSLWRSRNKPNQTQFLSAISVAGQRSTMLNCAICPPILQPANPFSSRCTSSIGSPITFVRLPSILSTNPSCS